MWFFSKSKKSKNKEPGKEELRVGKTDQLSEIKKIFEKKQYDQVYILAIETFNVSDKKIGTLVFAMDAAINICKELMESQKYNEVMTTVLRIAEVFRKWFYTEQILNTIGPKPLLLSEDELFQDAAHLVFRHQVASISLLQRRLNIGYARAGRIIDQLETAGIIEAFQGSKSRKVLIETKKELEAILASFGGDIYAYQDIKIREALFTYGFEAAEKLLEISTEPDQILADLKLLFESSLLLNPFKVTDKQRNIAKMIIDIESSYAFSYIVEASELEYHGSKEDREKINNLYFEAIEYKPQCWEAYNIILHNIWIGKFFERLLLPGYFKILIKAFGAPYAKFDYGLYSFYFKAFLELGSKVKLGLQDFADFLPNIDNFVQKNSTDSRSYVLLGWVYSGLLNHEKAMQSFKQAKSLSSSATVCYPISVLPREIKKKIWEILNFITSKYAVLNDILVNAYILNNFVKEPRLSIAFELNHQKYSNLPLISKVQIQEELLNFLKSEYPQIENWSIDWSIIHDDFAQLGMALVYEINENEWYLKMSEDTKKKLEAEREEERLEELREIEEGIRKATRETERRTMEQELREKKIATSPQLSKSMKVAAFLAGAAAGHGLFKLTESVFKDFFGDSSTKKTGDFKKESLFVR